MAKKSGSLRQNPWILAAILLPALARAREAARRASCQNNLKQFGLVFKMYANESGGGQFPGLDGHNIVLADPDGTREILARWLRDRRQITAQDLEPTSWSFAPLKTRGPVTFTGAANQLSVARAAGLHDIRQLKDHGNGTATYAIDLAHP